MNPFVTVSALEGPPSAALAPEALAACDLLLLCGQPAGGVAAADAACRAAGKAFYAGDCRGVYGWAFADLAEHTFVQEVSGWAVALKHLVRTCAAILSMLAGRKWSSATAAPTASTGSSPSHHPGTVPLPTPLPCLAPASLPAPCRPKWSRRTAAARRSVRSAASGLPAGRTRWAPACRASASSGSASSTCCCGVGAQNAW